MLAMRATQRYESHASYATLGCDTPPPTWQCQKLGVDFVVSELRLLPHPVEQRRHPRPLASEEPRVCKAGDGRGHHLHGEP